MLLLALLSLVSGPPAVGQARHCAVIDNPNPHVDGRFGYALEVLDFDRDGILDLAVGAPHGHGSSSGESGVAYVFYGPLSESSSFDVLVSHQPQAGDRYGWDLVAADVDGDGFEELAVSAPRAALNGIADRGYVDVWTWSDAPVPFARLTSKFASNRERFGTSLAAGNFMGGRGIEIAVGAPRAYDPGADLASGAVSLFRFQGDVARERRIYNPQATHDTNSFGHDLTSADWNADGRTDLIVSAIFNHVHINQVAYRFAGQAFVFESPVSTASATLQNPTPWFDEPILPGQPIPGCAYQRFGMSIAAGDLDQDGHAEVMVGAPRKDDREGVCDAGKAFVFSGAHWASPLDQNAAFAERPSPVEDDKVGYRVLTANLIGGPEPDLIVGSLSAERAHVIMAWRGSEVVGEQGNLETPHGAWVLPADHGPHSMGGLVAANLDGLGRDELIVGDFDHSVPNIQHAGRVIITCWEDN